MVEQKDAKNLIASNLVATTKFVSQDFDMWSGDGGKAEPGRE